MKNLRAEKSDEQRTKTRQHTRNYRAKNKENPIMKMKNRISSQIYRAKMKKLKQEQKLNEIKNHDGYKSKEIIQKKVREVEKALPKNPKKASQVCEELLKRHPVQSNQHPLKPKKPLTQDETKVLEFYKSEDNVVILPGKRDYVTRKNEEGKKVRMQKHVLKDSKENLFRKFKEEHPEVNSIHRTKFFKMSPQNVVSFKKMPDYACECNSHKNFEFLYASIKQYVTDENIDDYRKFRSQFSCDESDHDCMMGNCDICKNIVEKFKQLVSHHRTRIIINQWKGSEIIEHKLTMLQSIMEFSKSITAFKAHSYISHLQIKARNEQIKNLDENSALAVVDFAENMTLKQQNETQTAYYNRTNVTLYTCMLYVVNELKELKHLKIAFVSDNLQHNSNAANVFLRELLDKISNEHPRVKFLHLWSDGAPAHFKNKYSIANAITLQKKYKIEIVLNNTGSGHGKSVADSIGGTVKRMVGDRMKSQNIIIQSASNFAAHADEFCDGYEISFVSSEKIKSFEAAFNDQSSRVRAITGIRGRHKFVVIADDKIKSFSTSYDHDELQHKIFDP
jgi:hypothetical protein